MISLAIGLLADLGIVILFVRALRWLDRRIGAFRTSLLVTVVLFACGAYDSWRHAWVWMLVDFAVAVFVLAGLSRDVRTDRGRTDR